MQRMALMGLVGVSMAGLGAGAWGLQARSEKKPELLFSRSREVLCAEKGMGELADERRSLDAAHLVIRSRVENRQLLVRGFMAGHWSTDQVLQETMRINREIPRCVAVLQLHYPDSTELDIAKWHVVGLVENELASAQSSLGDWLAAEVWLQDEGLDSSLAW